MGVVSSPVPLLVGVVGFLRPPRNLEDDYALLGIILLAELVGLLFMLPVVKVRILLDQNGVLAHRLLGAPRFIRWDEVQSVVWSKSSSRFVISSRNGQKLKACAFLCGLTALNQAFREHLPPGDVPDGR